MPMPPSTVAERKEALVSIMRTRGFNRTDVARIISKTPRTVTRYLAKDNKAAPSDAEITALNAYGVVDTESIHVISDEEFERRIRHFPGVQKIQARETRRRYLEEHGDTGVTPDRNLPSGRVSEPPAPSPRPALSKPSVTAVVPSATRIAARLDHVVRDVVTLEIFTDIRARAGDAVEVYVEGTSFTIELPRFFVSSLLGFVPPPRLGVVICDGDSMSPMYEDGDLLLYEPAYEINGGGNYVIIIDGAVLAKRVQRLSGGGYKIISANREAGYEDEVLVPNGDPASPQLVNKLTDLVVSFHPVGKIRWPRPDADRVAVENVTNIIRNLIKSGQLST